MDLVPKGNAKETNRILDKIYHNTLGMCLNMIHQFDSVILTNSPFHERFSTNFKNNEKIADESSPQVS